MINLSADDQVAMSIAGLDPAEDDWVRAQIREALRENGGRAVDEGTGAIVDPVSIVIYVFVGAALIDFVSDVTERIRRRGESFVIVDTRKSPVEITVRGDVPEMRGRVLVVDDAGDRHEFEDVASAIDVGAFLKGLGGSQ